MSILKRIADFVALNNFGLFDASFALEKQTISVLPFFMLQIRYTM